MESSLNEAHHEERKADIFLNARRFQDAIQCHKTTIELLDKAIKLTTSERALESIRLQRDYHVRRQVVIEHKRSLSEARRGYLQRALKAAIDKMDAVNKDGRTRTATAATTTCTEQLQLAIYKNIDDNDSLLRFLHRDELNQQQLSENITSDICGSALAEVRGQSSRPPKDDKTIIEELRMNNWELRRLVDIFVADLEESRAEVTRLQRLMNDMKFRLQESDDEALAATHHRLPTLMTTDSSSNSPFVFSSSSSLSSAEIAEASTTTVGVRLAPLEMPPLMDFANGTQQQQCGKDDDDPANFNSP